MDPGFRKLDDRERGLLEKLLEVEFPGRDELRAQLASVTAKQIEKDGTLKLRCDLGPPAAIKSRLVAEAMCKDEDGGSMSVMLHVDREGFIRMLEVIKYDGTPVIRPPSARELVLLLPEDGGRKLGK
ncbi:MAG TPA: hypothetical protein VGH51_18345 [Candidatus Angelobacter sp.]|jgi:hypothetical protein